MSTVVDIAPRTPAVTDRTVSQNLQVNVPAQVYLDFDYAARKRGLSKSVMLRRMVEAITHDPRKLDKIIGKVKTP